MIQLGTQQLEAIEKFINFLPTSNISFCITGYAGTGKTTVLKEIINQLEKSRKQYLLCAPTHKAKVVLERVTDREGLTIHKLLALSPNVELENLDFKDLQFITKKTPSLFPKNGVIICDEASMIHDDLYDLLAEKAAKNNCKLLFLGDQKQLRAVNSKGFSKIFNLSNKYELTIIYRQLEDSGLVNILPELRNNIIPRFSTALGTSGSLICYSDIKEFFKAAIPYYKKAIQNNDILEVKMLAYTNARMSALNNKVKELLFTSGAEYNKFEFLTGYDNLEFNDGKFWNSMDYIVIDKPQECDINIHSFIKLPGYRLNLYDSASKSSNEILILKKDINKDYLDSLSYLIENIRLDAVKTKFSNKRQSSALWKDYYKIINGFTTSVDLYYDNRMIRKKSFDYGYASSVHKSQGSSINNVFIDIKNVNTCRDREELRQLQYVGVSRTIQNCHIYQ